MKYCSKCGTHKPFNAFSNNKAQKDGLCNWCKACVKAKEQPRRAATLQWFREYKSVLSCVKCGENHPATLDFHHLDPSTKDNHVYHFVKNGYSQAKILAEINKCSVLCSNCHRKLHYEERQSNESSSDEWFPV